MSSEPLTADEKKVLYQKLVGLLQRVEGQGGTEKVPFDLEEKEKKVLRQHRLFKIIASEYPPRSFLEAAWLKAWLWAMPRLVQTDTVIETEETVKYLELTLRDDLHKELVQALNQEHSAKTHAGEVTGHLPGFFQINPF